MPPSTNELFVKAQEKVFIKIGKCLLNLQLFEQGLKEFLPATDFVLRSEGPLQTVNYEKSMLGLLIEDLKNFLTTSEKESAAPSDTDTKLPPSEGPQMRIAVKIGLSEEAYSEAIKELTNLLAQRNELVHHFTEQFSLASIESCRSAVIYLDELNSKTRNLIDKLKYWDERRVETIRQALSPEMTHYYVYHYHKDLDTDWETTHVVYQLKEAEKIHAEDGWTNLELALIHMKREAADLTPKVYGCGSWRKLIIKSGVFEHRTIKASEPECGQFWYQSKGSKKA
jgi:hypothetical protein